MGIVKIAVFVPKSHANVVRKVIGENGGGKSGKYSHASFSVEGVGRFLPLKGSRPAIGNVGKIEEVEEERIEFVCERISVKKIIDEIRKVHPYEEMAFDIYPTISMDNL